jgi:hypothetical protein
LSHESFDPQLDSLWENVDTLSGKRLLDFADQVNQNGSHAKHMTNKRPDILLIGAAGNIGKILRSVLSERSNRLVSADIRQYQGLVRQPGAGRIGYQPLDNAEDYAATIAGDGLIENEVEAAFQGGPFCFDGEVGDVD